MNRHPARPASVYREPTEREAFRYSVRRFVQAMRAPASDLWRRIYQAMAVKVLPRNLFTTSPGTLPTGLDQFVDYVRRGNLERSERISADRFDRRITR